IMKKNYRADNSEKAEETLNEITAEVNRQQQDFYSIFNDGILPELRRQRVYLYQTHEPLPFHRDFVRRYFDEEIFPYLSPVTLHEGFRTFIRDRRLYLIARILKRETREPLYVLIKIPHSNVPRFIALPEHEGMHYFMFVDDMIRYNLPAIFPGYVPDGCYGIKISRDADIYVDEETPQSILQSIRTKVGKRKIGALSRFMYDREMPPDVLAFVRRSFHIAADDLVVGGRYMNLQDMIRLPNPIGAELVRTPPAPLRVPYLEELASMFRAVERGDVLLHFPYQSFDYLLRFLMEASFDPDVEEIKITQYRVAENSAVIHSLIGAARNGKRVTVFVELKARFDEENNMSTAEEMRQAGIKIIYSIPGLKVHAKVAVVLRRGEAADFACLSTGNFNEKTAKGYSDMALLTCDKAIVGDVCRVFEVLEGRLAEPHFVRLLVARFNMVPELIRLIRREADLARAGRGGRIILKMNGLQDKQMIDELYEAGQAGVEIDLLVRGICCLTPDRIYWVDGSEEEYNRLAQELVDAGTFVRLSDHEFPNSYAAFSDPDDVARVEERTFICSQTEEGAGPTNNWRDPVEMKQTLTGLFKGSMRGRTMYIIPFVMGSLKAKNPKMAVEITDSAYVVCSMRIMATIGKDVLAKLDETQGFFVKALHSVGAPLEPGQADVSWPCNPEKYIV
ncbi:MAG: polyphosphate kinase 1, partial [Tannerella sp.]